jgi:hypothetical protein
MGSTGRLRNDVIELESRRARKCLMLHLSISRGIETSASATSCDNSMTDSKKLKEFFSRLPVLMSGGASSAIEWSTGTMTRGKDRRPENKNGIFFTFKCEIILH